MRGGVKNPGTEAQALACPDRSGGIPRGTMSRLYVIPTEAEGSHGIPAEPATEKIPESLDFSTPLEMTCFYSLRLLLK